MKYFAYLVYVLLISNYVAAASNPYFFCDLPSRYQSIFSNSTSINDLIPALIKDYFNQRHTSTVAAYDILQQFSSFYAGLDAGTITKNNSNEAIRSAFENLNHYNEDVREAALQLLTKLTEKEAIADYEPVIRAALLNYERADTLRRSSAPVLLLVSLIRKKAITKNNSDKVIQSAFEKFDHGDRSKGVDKIALVLLIFLIEGEVIADYELVTSRVLARLPRAVAVLVSLVKSKAVLYHMRLIQDAAFNCCDSSELTVRGDALYLLTALVQKKIITDENISTSKQFSQVVEIASTNCNHPNDEIRMGALTLFESLVKEGIKAAYKNAIPAGSENCKHKSNSVRIKAFDLFKTLVEKEVITDYTSVNEIATLNKTHADPKVRDIVFSLILLLEKKKKLVRTLSKNDAVDNPVAVSKM